MALGEVTTLINYGQTPNYLQDALLSGQTQAAMQQKYDVNTAKIEGIVEQISAIPIQQEAGKRYLMEKLQGVLNTVSANMKVSGGYGILSNSYTGGIMSQIKASIDDKVKKHIKYSQDIINFQQGVSKLREKDPKLYNQANYEFAMYKAGLQNYLKGDVDADLGTLQYTPYKDVMGDALKKAKELKDLKGDQEIDIIDENNPSRMIKRTIKGLTVDEVIRYVPGILDSQDEQQIMIDGWADVRGTQDGGKTQLSNFLTQKKTNYQDEIAILKTKNSSNTDAEELKLYQARLKSYENKIADIDSQMGKIDQMPLEQRGYILKKSQVESTLADMFTGKVSETVDVNPIWKAEQEQIRSDREYALKMEEFNLKLKESGKKLSADGTVIETGEDIAYQGMTDQEYQEGDGKTTYQAFRGEYNKIYNNQSNIALSVFGDLDKNSDEYKGFVTSMKSKGFALNANGDGFTRVNDKAGSMTDAMTQAFDEAELDMIYPEQFAELNRLNMDRRKLSLALTEAESVGREAAIKKEAQDVMSSVRGNPLAAARVVSGRIGVLPINTPLTPFMLYTKNKVEGLAEEEAGKTLQKLGAFKYIQEKNRMIVSGDRFSKIISMIAPESMQEEVFDVKKGSAGSVTYDPSMQTYTIRQQVGNDKDGNPKYATAVVAAKNNSVGEYINSITQEKERYDSTQDFKKGTVFTSQYVGKMSDSSGNELYDNITNKIDKTVKDQSLATSLKYFSSKPDSIVLLQEAFMQRGDDEVTALQKATQIVNKVAKNEIIPATKVGNLGWYVEYYDPKGNFLFNKRSSNGDKLNTDVSTSVNMHRAQWTLSELYKMIQDGSAEEVLQKIL